MDDPPFHALREGMPSRPPTHRRTNQLTRWTNHAHSLTRSHGKDERKPWRKRTHGGGSHSCCSQRNIPCPREERSLFHSQSDRKQGNSIASAVLSNCNCLFFEFNSVLFWNSMNQASKSAGCFFRQKMCWGFIFQRVNVCPH